MARTLFVFALIVAAVSAFVQPTNHAVARPAFAQRIESPKMMVEGSDMAVSNLAQNANIIASSVDDFGGFLFPIVGLGLIAFAILFLSPPLADE
mmetsp:Transcript_26901/g.31297  ORF Transcript_26901/g.31297 Transcript_26901/m.31297 type:complete len:94 (+) Transcript_26901:77-358(+)